MELYEVVLVGTYFNQECVNRWNYTTTSTPGASTLAYSLLSALAFIPQGDPPTLPTEGLFAAIRALQNPSYVYNQVIAKNIYNLSDFYTLAYTSVQGGLAGGYASTPVVAYGLHSNQTTRAIRAGQKRFAGVSQDYVGNGGLIIVPALTALNTIAALMNEPATFNDGGSSTIFNPVVVGKMKYTTPSGKKAYKYYPTIEEQQTHLASGVIWNSMPQVRSQTSRQYGKGG